MVVEKPEVNAGRRALDFGVGFYLTSNREQAERWARAVARRRQSGDAILNCFEVDEGNLGLLKVLEFSGPNSDWLDFVVSNRKWYLKNRCQYWCLQNAFDDIDNIIKEKSLRKN